MEPSALWCFEMRWLGDIYTPSTEGVVAGFSVADCLAWSKALDVLLQAISVSSNVCLSAEASSRRKEMEVEHAGA